MNYAPERVWLDGDATIDEGVFPRCFATPKQASDPPMELIRADIHVATIARAERAEATLAIAEEALRKIDVGEGWAAQIAHAAITAFNKTHKGDKNEQA